ncbi:hypothetical protein [Streptomyces sp. MBT53]|uniref:hypothetical protein n=1 Tax=Streptomyces sp. MBT53 TaxID=1488384 RepID=UPI00191458E5|nr:hypothetical protein [Streptomyces sp. MBT53]MBK6015162.1 hypothetical protein [Streptomyces sp. MBT53]
MIRPEKVNVSVNCGSGDDVDVWLYFDANLLVEIKPDLARTLVVDLAEQVGMFAGVRNDSSSRGAWPAIRAAIRGSWRQFRGVEGRK